MRQSFGLFKKKTTTNIRGGLANAIERTDRRWPFDQWYDDDPSCGRQAATPQPKFSLMHGREECQVNKLSSCFQDVVPFDKP